MKIDGHVALITGAGSGLGEATARRMAKAGAKVVVLDRALPAAEKVAAEIGGLAIACDVADVAAVDSAFEQAQTHFADVARIVVSCAGIGTAERILPRDGKLTVEGFDRTLRVNLIGTYTVMNIAARAMGSAEPVDEDGARGVIINTASVAYQDGQIGQAAYSASKGGIVSMTLPAAREFSRIGVRVVAIAPGLFETAMSAGLPEEVRTQLLMNVPFPHRLGHPDEYAQLVEHIAQNAMINGEVIRLDASARMPAK